MSTRPTPREQAREQTMRRILAIARRQLETQGAAGLSLREVTRELGMVSSAVYRYVSGRDELLTLLLVDAFAELADTVDSALAAAAGRGEDEPRTAREQLRVLAGAMHSWAVDNRARWTLLYGTPVAEFHAPPEVTTHPGTRVVGRVLRVIVAAGGAGADGPHPAPGQSGGHGARDAPDSLPGMSLSPALAGHLDRAAAELDAAATGPQQIAAITFFSGVVGAINAELFTHWGPQFTEHGTELFAAQVEVLLGAVATSGTSGPIR